MTPESLTHLNSSNTHILSECDRPQYLLDQFLISECVPMELIFSTRSRSLTGLRRSEVYNDHRLYRSPQLWLDVQMERDNRTFHTALKGQLGDWKNPLKPLVSVPVFLMSGKRVLASTVSNRQGEFKLEFDSLNRTTLCMMVKNGRMVRVSME